MSCFIGDDYRLGIIPCTSKKRAGGTTPTSLYMGGPFAMMMKHAQQRCGAILIMSAKYGLLQLDDPVAYYDIYLADMSDESRAALRNKVRNQRRLIQPYTEGRILSYLPKGYFDLLAEALPDIAELCRRPYKRLPSLPLLSTLSAEHKNYGKNPAMR